MLDVKLCHFMSEGELGLLLAACPHLLALRAPRWATGAHLRALAPLTRLQVWTPRTPRNSALATCRTARRNAYSIWLHCVTVPCRGEAELVGLAGLDCLRFRTVHNWRVYGELPVAWQLSKQPCLSVPVPDIYAACRPSNLPPSLP